MQKLLSNVKVLDAAIAEYSAKISYSQLCGITEYPQIYMPVSTKGHRALTLGAIMPMPGHIKAYFPELDLYGSYSQSEFCELASELAKIKYKNLRQIIAPGQVSKFAVVVDSGAAAVKKLMIEYFGTSDVVCEGTTCVAARPCVTVHTQVASLHDIPSDTRPRDYDTMFAQFVAAVDPDCNLGIRQVSMRSFGAANVSLSTGPYKYINCRDTILADDPESAPYPTEHYTGGCEPGPCLYFLQLNKPFTDCYKYGITDNLRERLKKHKHKIHYWKVVRVFPVSANLREVERQYKKSATDRGVLAPRLGYTEVVQTGDPTAELAIIESIIAKSL